MARPDKALFGRDHDFWLARGAVLVIVVLQIAIVNDLAIGPRWFAPSVELALLIPLTIATAWTQRRARKASTKEQVGRVWRGRMRTRRLAITLTAIVTAMNFGALARLLEAILTGHAGSGRTLLLDAVNIWATNLIIFALWFWALDRGGPAGKLLGSGHGNDFIFTQQQPGARYPNWSPGFIDYLFLAFTNATAFSPADTFPLTARAKLLMMAESGISLVTIALVASRAVGILG
jgi:hypothetical protein